MTTAISIAKPAEVERMLAFPEHQILAPDEVKLVTDMTNGFWTVKTKRIGEAFGADEISSTLTRLIVARSITFEGEDIEYPSMDAGMIARRVELGQNLAQLELLRWRFDIEPGDVPAENVRAYEVGYTPHNFYGDGELTFRINDVVKAIDAKMMYGVSRELDSLYPGGEVCSVVLPDVAVQA